MDNIYEIEENLTALMSEITEAILDTRTDDIKTRELKVMHHTLKAVLHSLGSDGQGIELF